MESRLGAAPKGDLDLVEQRARGEADWKRARIEIERAAGIEDARRCWAAGGEADLAMRNIDQTMRGSLEHRLEHGPDIGGGGAVRPPGAPRIGGARPRPAIGSLSWGPSHKAARLSPPPAEPSCEGNSAPNAM